MRLRSGPRILYILGVTEHHNENTMYDYSTRKPAPEIGPAMIRSSNGNEQQLASGRGRMGVQISLSDAEMRDASRSKDGNTGAAAAVNNEFKGSEPCDMPAPATVAATLPSRGGEPLPDAIRSQAESELGSSFAGVRVHDDREAHRMADAVHSHAFTYGEDIAFRAGAYAPGTARGRELLRHELGHVAAEGAGAGAGSAGEIHRAPRYDRYNNYHLPPVPAHATASGLATQIAATIPTNIASYTLKGVAAGSPEEIFLLHVILQLGQRDRWDTFTRLETPIGWPATATDPTPMGLVSLLIDGAGAVTAELMSAGPLKRPPVVPAADAKRSLAPFKLSKIGGDKAWTDAELTDVAESLKRIPAADRKALEGVELLRVATLPKGYSGMFTSGGGVASGATRQTVEPSLKLADSAFASTASFVGDMAHQAPSSFGTILHEVGHAVENGPRRAANEQIITAAIEQNQAAKDEDKASKNYYKKGASKADQDKATEDYAKAKKAHSSAVTAKSNADKAYKKTVVSTAVTAPLAADAKTATAASKAALQTARKAVAGFSAQDQTDSAAYRSAVDGVQKAMEKYLTKISADKEISENEDDVVLQAIEKRNNERDALAKSFPANPALTAFAPADKAHDDWFHAERMLAHTYDRSLRLQAFVKIVNDAKLTPITAYAKDNWPYEPQEFYAESYSIWLNDPEFLRTYYKPIFDFFDTGAYRK